MKNLDPKNHLNLFNNNDRVNIEVGSYSQLGSLLDSVISVSQTALTALSDAQNFTEVEKQKILGCSSLDIANVLEFIKKIIPHSELEYLDEIKSQL